MSLTLSIVPRDPERDTLVIRLPRPQYIPGGILLLRASWRRITPEESMFPTLYVRARMPWTSTYAFEAFVRPYDQSANAVYLPLPSGTCGPVTCHDHTLLLGDTIRAIYRPKRGGSDRYSPVEVTISAAPEIEIVRQQILVRAGISLEEYGSYGPGTTRAAIEARMRSFQRAEHAERAS